MSGSAQRRCWCGYPHLENYSDDYHVCRACGTLVSRAPLVPDVADQAKAEDGLYSRDYWLGRQSDHHGLPEIHQRARLDLPERCTHWLRHLLAHRAPPGKVLEIGCGHGAYVALLGWSGFEAYGTELSPWVVDFARNTFGIDARCGPVEQQDFAPGTFDVLVLNDVIEHLPDPLATLTHCATLLKPDGFFVIQTPEYKEHLGYADLQAANDLFLRHMDGNNEEHLFLFSRRSAAQFFARLGFDTVAFAQPVYSYDLFFTASRGALRNLTDGEVSNALAARPVSRLVQALLDKAYESTDRWWAMQRLEAQLRANGGR